tara:strand:+ start:1405 stop:1581 length:177 start_codon:yes stop_codon:yes gene_type:complete
MRTYEEEKVDLVLAQLKNVMDTLYKLHRQTDIVDGYEYQKINRAIWDIEQLLKEWKEE